MDDKYIAQYTVLIDGATWGSEEIEIDADSDEEALENALEYQDNFCIVRNHKREERLLDYVYDKNGKEIYS